MILVSIFAEVCSLDEMFILRLFWVILEYSIYIVFGMIFAMLSIIRYRTLQFYNE